MAKLNINTDWQAEEDARTLGRYQELISDNKRLNKALKMAKKQAADLQERASYLNKSVSSARRKK